MSRNEYQAMAGRGSNGLRRSRQWGFLTLIPYPVHYGTTPDPCPSPALDHRFEGEKDTVMAFSHIQSWPAPRFPTHQLQHRRDDQERHPGSYEECHAGLATHLGTSLLQARGGPVPWYGVKFAARFRAFSRERDQRSSHCNGYMLGLLMVGLILRSATLFCFFSTWECQLTCGHFF